jgi:antitoxin component of MazEF toxin-antitoxin module
MGEKTTLTKASTKSESLRTTVPSGIVKQFYLTEGDQIEWEIKVADGKLAILIKPIKK